MNRPPLWAGGYTRKVLFGLTGKQVKIADVLPVEQARKVYKRFTCWAGEKGLPPLRLSSK